jgi:hypothetical protein
MALHHPPFLWPLSDSRAGIGIRFEWPKNQCTIHSHETDFCSIPESSSLYLPQKIQNVTSHLKKTASGWKQLGKVAGKVTA